MSRIKRGFTIIEISIFLALTGLIFIGMIVGIQSSLTQNHYDDDVRNLVDFFHNAYSKVINVESDTKGNSEKVIYGKLITIGETYNLAGESNSDGDIFIYDVIGNASGNEVGSNLVALRYLQANVTVSDGATVKYAGIADSYRSRWGTVIETTANTGTKAKAAILIARSPSTGITNTYIKNTGTLEVNKDRVENRTNTLLNSLNHDEFKLASLDLCISMEGKVYNGKRKDVHFDRGSNSSSGVREVHLDDSQNKCQ